MTAKNSVRVFAVVVAYLPEISALADLLNLLAAQVERIFVVDNSPLDDLRVERLCRKMDASNVELIALGENLGVATALNVGIRSAKLAGADHVLLSDQDSVPAIDMVAGLLRAREALCTQGFKVAAVGPSFTNVNSGKLFAFHVELKGRPLYGRRSASVEQPQVEVLTLITSGTLASIEALDVIGPMREDFFIDCVDTEWCYRARALGYVLYGTLWATMVHRMGDATLRVWFFGWIKANAHSPLRIYYQTRNLLRLHYLGYRGMRWRLRNIWSITAIFYCHVIFGASRFASLRMALLGLFDGFRGRMGKFGS